MTRDLQDPNCGNIIDRHAAYWWRDPGEPPGQTIEPSYDHPIIQIEPAAGSEAAA